MNGLVFYGKTGESRTRPRTLVGGAGGSKLGHPKPVSCPDIVSLPFSSYAFKRHIGPGCGVGSYHAGGLKFPFSLGGKRPMHPHLGYVNLKNT